MPPKAPQLPQAAQASASPGRCCAKATLLISGMPNKASRVRMDRAGLSFGLLGSFGLSCIVPPMWFTGAACCRFGLVRRADVAERPSSATAARPWR